MQSSVRYGTTDPLIRKTKSILGVIDEALVESEHGSSIDDDSCESEALLAQSGDKVDGGDEEAVLVGSGDEGTGVISMVNHAEFTRTNWGRKWLHAYRSPATAVSNHIQIWQYV